MINTIMKKEEAYNKIIKGECNVEARDYGIENSNAETFAESNLNLLTVEDLEFNQETGEWFANSEKIDTEFTKDWPNYSGAGYISIVSW